DAPDVVAPLLQDPDPGARLMNLELAPPGADPRRRAAALFGLGDALGEEARVDALLLAGYNHLALGNAEEALSCFDSVTSERPDAEKLLALITRRLEVAEEPDELAKLFWERARVLRQKGDRAGAIAALENVTMIEPDHVGALALMGEIDITQSNFEAAAKSL